MINNLRMSQKTEKLLRLHGYFSAAIDVFGLIKDMGIELTRAKIEPEMSGCIKILGDQASIIVNSAHHPHRQRFTAAHELGHYVLHRGSSEELLFEDGSFSKAIVDKRREGVRRVFNRDRVSGQGTNQIEIEANRFASTLLMPEALIEEMVLKLNIDITDDSDIKRLSKRFKVSEQAMIHRITNLGITFL